MQSIAKASLIVWSTIAVTFSLVYVFGGGFVFAILGILGWMGCFAAWQSYEQHRNSGE